MSCGHCVRCDRRMGREQPTHFSESIESLSRSSQESVYSNDDFEHVADRLQDGFEMKHEGLGTEVLIDRSHSGRSFFIGNECESRGSKDLSYYESDCFISNGCESSASHFRCASDVLVQPMHVSESLEPISSSSQESCDSNDQVQHGSDIMQDK